MQIKITLLAVLGLSFFGQSPKAIAQSDTLYVNHAAVGTNDGASWENAFSELQNALATATAGDEIWVAQGTYFPDTTGGDSTATFLVDKNIKLLGGFNGDPNGQPNEQDPDQWITRLSGDLNEDDIFDNLDSNRTDNVMTVLTVAAEVDSTALIDGFYITNGHADGGDAAFQHRRGGGVFSFGSPRISHCVFEKNVAVTAGGGLYFHTGNAAGALVESCLFVENRAEEGGAGATFIVGDEGVVFRQCSFDNNVATEQGGALRIYNSNCVVDDCQFQFNRAIGGRGGAVDVRSIFDGNETIVKNSFFSENTARHGGAVNFRTNSPLGAHDNFFSIDSSEFMLNHTTVEDPEDTLGNQGGAVRITIERTTSGCGASITNSFFTQNTSRKDGGAIVARLQGETMEFLVENCFLDGNGAENAGALEIMASDIGNGLAMVRNCIFLGNEATENAGALRLLGQESSNLSYVVVDCDFTLNTCDFSGGAIVIESRDTAMMDVQVEESIFLENFSLATGGALTAETDGGFLDARFSRCAFSRNEAGESGAILSGRPSVGGGVLGFVNCLISENSSDDAVISLDSFPAVEMLNCTLADNLTNGLLSLNESQYRVRNCILSNPDFTEFIVDENVGVFTSLGGNVIADNSLDFILGEFDQGDADPQFEYLIENPYHLLESSPAVDAGILPDDAPEVDFDGNDRVVNCIDAGAFESPFMVGTACLTSVLEASPKPRFNFFPNPADEVVTLNFAEGISSRMRIEILDVNGRLLRSEEFLRSEKHQMDVSNLRSGVYLLRLTTDAGSAAERLVVR